MTDAGKIIAEMYLACVVTLDQTCRRERGDLTWLLVELQSVQR